MRVLVTGSSGLVGSLLLPTLTQAGHEAGLLVRSSGHTNTRSFAWDPATGQIDARGLEEWKPEAVVHLAGKNIARHRWNDEVKRAIRESRVEATDRLCRSLLNLSHPPSVFISASAIGYYGNRREEELDETSAPGTEFLSEVVKGWEAAGAQMHQAGVRTVWLRFGMILSTEGGALATMLPVFKFGLGGPTGSGRQWISWISREDAVRLILFCLQEPIAGAINAVTPNPVRNREFTLMLAQALGRPSVLRAPGFALCAGLGEMAEALLLTSQRVFPRRLDSTDFAFRDPELGPCLRRLLENKK